MRFVDRVRILVRAGHGGRGHVGWRREKFVPYGGPAGGDGGRGGDVVLVADDSLTTLLDLRYRQHYQAEHGQPGRNKCQNGKGGDDLRIRVPVGTVIYLEAEAGEPGERPPWHQGDAAGEEGDLETIYVFEDELEGDDDEGDEDEGASSSGDEAERADASADAAVGDAPTDGPGLEAAEGEAAEGEDADEDADDDAADDDATDEATTDEAATDAGAPPVILVEGAARAARSDPPRADEDAKADADGEHLEARQSEDASDESDDESEGSESDAGADAEEDLEASTSGAEEDLEASASDTEEDPEEDPEDEALDGAEDLEPGDEPSELPTLGDLVADHQALIVAKGGRGGRGNIHFRSSTNRAPDFAESGTRGQAFWLRLELKLLADVGIVGFPNVGKSTLIRTVSRARPRVGDYPFTTLVPHLGVVGLPGERSFVLADVPGLIRGASEGKGLGLDFLRHLERTRVLLHLLAPDPDEERAPIADLEALEEELAAYGDVFAGRPRVVALNKVDTAEGRALIERTWRILRGRQIPLFPISAATGEGVPALLEALWRRVALSRERAAAAAAAKAAEEAANPPPPPLHKRRRPRRRDRSPRETPDA